MALAEVYVDESGTHDGSPVLCVAGYVFYRRHALEFTKKHSADLKRIGVPYFHAKECNPGRGAYAEISKEGRLWSQTSLIKKTREFTQYGFAASVNEAEFDSVVGSNGYAHNAYSFLLWMGLCAVGNWIERVNFQGKVSYIFEAGHKHQGKANALMNEIFLAPDLREKFRYGQHGFSPKECAVPLQSADLFAWHWFTDHKKRLAGKPRRKDLDALIVGGRDSAAHFSKAALEQHAADIEYLRRFPSSC